MLKAKVESQFKQRRSRLMSHELAENSVFVFPSNNEVFRNSDVAYPFRQESSFYYLTGFDEPSSVLVLAPSKKGGYESVLFVQKKDPLMEMWEGARYGVEGAVEVFGVDKAYPIDEIDNHLSDYFKNAQKLFYKLGKNIDFDQKVLTALDKHKRSKGRTGEGTLTV